VRVAFMGTPSFAVPSLMALVATHDVVAVYTRPDKASGRGLEPQPSPVKQAALALGIEVRQPPTLRDEAVVAALAASRPDVVCVAAYGLILPQPVIDLPPLGCINVHASLLPRWRGAAPIQRAILAGDEIAGVSIMRMEVGLDTGPFCTALDTPVDAHTAETLTALLGILGAKALVDALPSIEDATARWVVQDDALATYAEKVGKADVALAPTLSVADAWRRVRASTPQAPCRLALDGMPVTVLRAEPIDRDVPSGLVGVDKRTLALGFPDGALALEELTPQGRKSMEGAAYARGARLESGATWSAIEVAE